VPRPFAFDRTWVFAASPHEFFATVAQTDEFTRWWSWLRVFDVDGPEPAGLHAGARARCVIQAPLPYALRLTIAVEEVEADALVATQVDGDLRGPARLEIAPHPDGCTARLVWSLELRDPILRNVAVFARPAMVWAHDRVVAAGVADFERRARFSRPA
jgi:Polyketide cyclase / dehydrase and lipid transport